MSEPGSDQVVVLCRSIDDTDGPDWDSVVADKSLFLQRLYLRCLETETGDQLRHRYALFLDGQRPVGVASFQITDFVGRPVDLLLDSNAPGVSFIARKLGLTGGSLTFRMIVCGSAFTSGEHGFVFSPDIEPERATRFLMAAVREIEREQAAQEGFTAVLFKEFYPSSSSTAELLKTHSFSELDAGPNMILLLDPSWRTFDDYLGSLSSKYRVKAKRAYAKSTALTARALTVADLTRYDARVRELYDAVLSRADYRLGKLDTGALRNWRATLKDELILEGYFLNEDELVGFMSGFVVGDTLEAHLVGFDYTLNREHAIYPRMLYDYFRVALDRRLSRIHYGRTAEEIKSTLGAAPVAMKCYVRHREKSLNRLLPALARYIRLPESPLRKPFKKAWYMMNQTAPGQPLAVSH